MRALGPHGFHKDRTIRFLEMRSGRRITLPQLLNFIEISPTGFHIIDTTGQIKHVNNKWLEMMGYPREEFDTLGADDVRKTIFTHIREDHVADARANFRLKLQDPTNATSERREFRVYKRKDGSDIYVETHDTFLKDSKTGKITILTSFQDVTERVLAMKCERLAIVGQSTAEVMHSLNNMLTALCGNLDLALLQPDTTTLSNLRDRLSLALETSRRMGSLVGGLLNLARLGSDKPAPIRIRENLDRVITMCNEVFGKAERVTLKRSYPTLSPDIAVLMSLASLDDIMINLIKNAIEACAMQIDRARPREVTISAESFGLDKLKIAVTDTGVGMTSVQMSKLFRGQVDTTKGDKGTGLGLWTVNQAVEAANGKIEVRSIVGTSTTFELTLPIVKPLSSPPAPITPQPISALDISLRREDAARVKIWFIDDDLDQIEITGSLLRRMGFNPTTFDRADAALARLRNPDSPGEFPDIIIIDQTLCGDDINGQTFIIEAARILTGKTVSYVLHSGLPIDPQTEGLRNMASSNQLTFTSKDVEGINRFKQTIIALAQKALGRA